MDIKTLTKIKEDLDNAGFRTLEIRDGCTYDEYGIVISGGFFTAIRAFGFIWKKYMLNKPKPEWSLSKIESMDYQFRMIYGNSRMLIFTNK